MPFLNDCKEFVKKYINFDETVKCEKMNNRFKENMNYKKILIEQQKFCSNEKKITNFQVFF